MQNLPYPEPECLDIKLEHILKADDEASSAYFVVCDTENTDETKLKPKEATIR